MRHSFLAAFLFFAGTANAAVLTFDDISGSAPGSIADGYGGLNWTNLRSMFGCWVYPESGYCNGTVSGFNIAYNMYANMGVTSSNSEFNFDGVYLTGAWNDDLNIRVQGFNSENLIYDTTVVANYGGPTWFDFSYVGIDRLEFTSFGGVDSNAGDAGSGTHFVMDNFTYSVVPIPAAVYLFGSGLGLLGWCRRRKTA